MVSTDRRRAMSDAEKKLEELEANVRLMRQLQKEYYKTRDHGLLVKSKEQERVVDRMIDRQQELGL